MALRDGMACDPRTIDGLGLSAGKLFGVRAKTLWAQALKVTDDNHMAHGNLGVALIGRGKVDEAVVHCRSALEIKPDYAEAHNNLALALAGRGQVDGGYCSLPEGLEGSSPILPRLITTSAMPWPIADRLMRPSLVIGTPWRSNRIMSRLTITWVSLLLAPDGLMKQ